MRWCLVLALAAGPAAADCVSPARLPVRATYADGSSIDFLSREDGVIRYEDAASKSVNVVYRARAGVWLLNFPTPTGEMPIRFEGVLPDVAQIRAAGRAEVLGTTDPPPGMPAQALPVRMAIEWIGSVDFPLDGCTYRLEGLRRDIQVGENRFPTGEIWVEPALMIGFRSVFVGRDGRQRAYELTALE